MRRCVAHIAPYLTQNKTLEQKVKASTATVVMSQKRLDPFAAFNKSSQTVQGQIPARQNSRGLDKDGLGTRQRIGAGG